MLFDWDKLLKLKKDLQKEMIKPDFWDKPERAQKIARRNNQIKSRIQTFEKLEEKLEEGEVLIELAQEEGKNSSLWGEIRDTVDTLEKFLERMELKFRLSGPYDEKNAIISI